MRGGKECFVSDILQGNFLSEIVGDKFFDFQRQRTEIFGIQIDGELFEYTSENERQALGIVRHLSMNFIAGGKEQPYFVSHAVDNM